jgi:hypothetical protein
MRTTALSFAVNVKTIQAERAPNLPRCGSRFLLWLAAKFLVRKTRPVFRLCHPEDPVYWLALCEFSA